ncbi:MAG: hypothetical protein IKV44_06110, partial [Clostridia bacterium]|nr:hypothetical protein [Clostridia bacterium]
MKSKRILLTLFVCILTIFTLSVTSLGASNGDVDEDGIYSTKDAQLVLTYAAGLDVPDTVQQTAADIDRDGYITTDDAREILRVACELSVAPSHRYTVWLVTKEPTCTEAGIAQSGCYDCQDVFYKALPATGHTPNGVTCTEGGICAVCNVVLPATGHSYVNSVCSVCGYSNAKQTVTYNGKSVIFGSTAESTRALLGNPTEVLYDNGSSLGKITIYVYAADYKNLGIFTFTGNKLTQFYSNNKTSSVSFGSLKYSLNSARVDIGDNEEYTSVADIEITEYVDTHATSGACVYSYTASVDGSYNFSCTTNRTTAEKLVFHITNGLRALNGKSALIYCPTASNAAYKHSLDMATRDYFAHVSPEGKDPSHRLIAEGLSIMGYGENIAAGYTD